MAAYLDEWARDVTLGVRSRTGAMPFHFGRLRAQRRTYLAEAERLAAGDPVAQRRVATIVRMHRLAEVIMDVDITSARSDQLRDKVDLAGARRELDGSRRSLATAKGMADEPIAEKRGLVDAEIAASVFFAKEQGIAARDKKLAASPAPAASPGAAPAAAASVAP